MVVTMAVWYITGDVLEECGTFPFMVGFLLMEAACSSQMPKKDLPDYIMDCVLE
jgi:hypothetical protein